MGESTADTGLRERLAEARSLADTLDARGNRSMDSDLCAAAGLLRLLVENAADRDRLAAEVARVRAVADRWKRYGTSDLYRYADILLSELDHSAATEAALDGGGEAPGCDHPAPDLDTWFDRSVCPEPCGAMHTRCTACGTALGGCPLDAAPANRTGEAGDA